MSWLDDLKELAEKATPGPYGYGFDDRCFIQSESVVRTIVDHVPVMPGEPDRQEADAAYLSSCSPERVLALLKFVREIENVFNTSTRQDIKPGSLYAALSELEQA